MKDIVGAYVQAEQLLALRHRKASATLHNQRILGRQAGSRLSRQKGRGVDFAEVREYYPGDDVRAIDWRVTARKNKPHTKVFREERERPTLIFIDQSQTMFFGSRVRLKSVLAAEIAATLAWQALTDNDRVGGLVLGNDRYRVHKPFRSNRAVARLLTDAAEFNQALNRHGRSNAQTLDAAIQGLRRLAKARYRLFLISDFAHTGVHWPDLIHDFAKHNQVTVVHTIDPLEQALPAALSAQGNFTVTNGQTRLQFNAANPKLQRHYAQHFQHRQRELQAACAHEAIRYFTVFTNDLELYELKRAV